jgi:hypothetical protein
MELTQISDQFFVFQAKAPADLTVFNQTDDTSRGIIRFGLNNNFPQEIIKSVQTSPIANSCVETHAKFLYGDGLQFITESGQETEFSQKLKRIFNDAFYQKVCYDMAYFESFGLIMQFNINGYLSSVKNQDFSTIRLGVPNYETSEITYGKLSSNWQQENKLKRYKAVSIDLFNDIDTKAKINNFSINGLYDEFSKWNGALNYVRRYKPGQVYYSQPKYASALKWIYADAQIQNFHANNIDNSFAPAFIVYVPYKLDGTDENGLPMKESLRNYIADRLTGADNGGKFAILDGAQKEGSIQIVPFTQNTSSEMFITLSNLIRDHIATAFQVPPILAGIQVAGKLGTAKEIADATLYYQNAVITHDQNLLMYEFNKLAKMIEGYDGTIIDVSNAIPLGFIADSFASAFTEDEIRDAFGYGGKEVKLNTKATNIIDNINSLSPLVANKVLESLSIEEIRSLVGLLGSKPNSTIVPPVNPLP